MKRIILALSVVLVLIIFSCKKDPEITGGNKIEIAASSIDTSSYFTAKITSSVSTFGGNTITEHGHCWSESKAPTTENNHTSLGPLEETGNFSSILDTLQDNTTYYFRAYLNYGRGIVYGQEQSFKTNKAGIPVCDSTKVSGISLSEAVFESGTIADSGLQITTKGFCWDTATVVTLETCLDSTLNGTGLGGYTQSVTSLSEGLHYTVRSFAINERGVSYGAPKTFSTTAVTIPLVTTRFVTSQGATWAVTGGQVTDDGHGTLIGRGVCWSLSDTPSLDECLGYTVDGTELGEFESTITGLQESTFYYYRAYATNEKGTGYGITNQFTTNEITLPEVTTASFSNITLNAAIGGGNITSEGGGSVDARGVCYSTSEQPSLLNAHTSDGEGPGDYESQMTDLQTSTQYFVRAYATNEKGTAYGDQLSFTTLSDIITPVVTTAEISNISQTTAQGGGTVTSDGGGTVSARGVCWSTASNPTTLNDHTEDGTGTGIFISALFDLTSNTTYFVRAYATNEAGTTYGTEKTFSTLADPVLPTLTTTPASNITQTTANSGGNITNDGGAAVSQRGVCWSTQQNPDLNNNHTSDGTGSGSYSSLITGLTSNTFYYIRAYATNSVGTAYGNQITILTSQQPTLPTVSTAEAINITESGATTGGTVHADGGADVTARGVCYSTSPDPTLSNGYTINGSGLGAFVSVLSGLSSNTTYYVKAYATNSEGTAYGEQVTFITLSNLTTPTVTTNSIIDITENTATGGGNVTADGGADVSARGICWSTNPAPTLSDAHTTDGSGLGAYTSYLTGLSSSTGYYVRAYATNSVGTAYGAEEYFITLDPPWTCGDPIIYEGQSYGTVQIGDQCWMSENLNVGIRIDGIQESTNNGQIEKYCHSDDVTNCEEYGGLYQWDEMMEYTTVEGVQGICPSGWHIPTDNEWKILEGTVDSQYGVGNPEWDNINDRGYDAGKKLKTVDGWYLNTGTNDYDFSALPSGSRDYDGDFFDNLTKTCSWWSSSESNSETSWYRHLFFNYDNINRYPYNKHYGFSVRCVKN